MNYDAPQEIHEKKSKLSAKDLWKKMMRPFKRESISSQAEVESAPEMAPLFGRTDRESWRVAGDTVQKAKDALSQEKRTRGISQTFTVRLPYVRGESQFPLESISNPVSVRPEINSFLFLNSMGYEDITPEMIKEAEDALVRVKETFASQASDSSIQALFERLQGMIDIGKEKRARFVNEHGE